MDYLRKPNHLADTVLNVVEQCNLPGFATFVFETHVSSVEVARVPGTRPRLHLEFEEPGKSHESFSVKIEPMDCSRHVLLLLFWFLEKSLQKLTPCR